MELIVDNFAGGGGASTGIEMATGRSVDIAINHDPDAIAMHRANHPRTKHYCEDVWQVDPVEACAGNPVGLAWFSPDCTHFSRAKGGKPVDKNIPYPNPMSPCIDHIIPIDKGGHPSDIDNLQLAHMTCNRQKSNKIATSKGQKANEVISNRILPQSCDWTKYRDSEKKSR